MESEKELNGAPCVCPKEFKGPFYGVGMGKIFVKTHCGDTNVIDIRGWGYLTGTGGGLAMTEDEAIKKQTQFEEWVIAALNAYEKQHHGN